MKLNDRVRLIHLKQSYSDAGLQIGDQGTIMGENRNGYYLIYFDGSIVLGTDGVYRTTETDIAVKAEDIEAIQ